MCEQEAAKQPRGLAGQPPGFMSFSEINPPAGGRIEGGSAPLKLPPEQTCDQWRAKPGIVNKLWRGVRTNQ